MDIRDMPVNDFYEQFKGLVHYVVNRIPNKRSIEIRAGFTKEDLIQIGFVCLFNVKSKYKENKGKFISYAIKSIQLYILGQVIEHSSSINFSRELKILHFKLLKAGDMEKDDYVLAVKYNTSITQIKKAKSIQLHTVSTDVKLYEEEDDATVLDVITKQESFDNAVIDQVVVDEFFKGIKERDKQIYLEHFNLEKSQRELGEKYNVSHTAIYLSLKKVEQKAKQYLIS